MVDPVLTPAPAPDSARSPARSSLRQIVLPWFLFALTLALAGFLSWRLLQPADAGDPLATSLVAFERQNSLTVFSAELAPVVSSDDSRLFGLVKAKQVAVIPARIDYTVDLAAVDRNRMRWDAATKTLTVRLPPLRLSRPNLDEARAQYLREGMWIGREAQDKLTRENTLMAERLAGQQAANPVLMGLARNAAKDAVRQNLAIPMQVAGFGGVTVTVTIDGESTG